MAYISEILYWISTGLLVPVVLALIFLFVRSLVLLGGFFGQYQSMRRSELFLRRWLPELSTGNIDEFERMLPTDSSDMTIVFMRRLFKARDSQAKIEYVLSEAEIEGDRELGVQVMLAKMGPTIGLMGTLIPMGPALVGLASGDISTMAYNMQVAFATTVVGLFASVVGFLTKQVKQRWNMRRLSDLELVASLLNEQMDGKSCADAD